MSYDLMVFAVAAAPKERAQFLDWFQAQTEWSEGHSYDDPDICIPELKAWFMEMIQLFPAMNGPFSSDELPDDESSLTDYCIGQHVIYAAFSWSKVEPAYAVTFAVAAKHGVGFFDVSSNDTAVWLPDGNGNLKLAHST